MQMTPITPRFSALAYTPQDAATLREDLKNRRILLWDVDTQKGFMEPIAQKKIDGQNHRVGLYVDGALEIIPNLEKITRLGERFRLPQVATMDSHDRMDPEFRHFTAVSDEHCRKGAADWPKIGETTRRGIPLNVEVSPRIKDTPSTEDLQAAFEQGRTILIEKNTISAFQRRRGQTESEERFVPNRKAINIVESAKALGIRTAVVYGVATDFCVKAAVKGLKALGIRPVVVEDAIKGVTTNNLEAPIHEGVYDDVTIMSTHDLEAAVKDVYGK